MIDKGRRGRSIGIGVIGGACILEDDLELDLGGGLSCGDRSIP